MTHERGREFAEMHDRDNLERSQGPNLLLPSKRSPSSDSLITVYPQEFQTAYLFSVYYTYKILLYIYLSNILYSAPAVDTGAC